MRALAFLFFLFASQAHAESCRAIAALLETRISSPAFSVGVDFDSTVVDTDEVLISSVIPQALLEASLIVDDPGPLLEFQQRLKDERILPSRYSEEAWRLWGFPVDFLPRARRPGFSPLESFWAQMSRIFKSHGHSRELLPTIDEFVEFYGQMNSVFGARISWVMITARTEDSLEAVTRSMSQLSPSAYPIQILSRKAERGKTSAENARFKAQQIQQQQSASSRPLRVFLDNDEENLLEVNRRSDLGVVTLQMKKLSTPQPGFAIQIFPE